jgi:hypothetical protein
MYKKTINKSTKQYNIKLISNKKKSLSFIKKKSISNEIVIHTYILSMSPIVVPQRNAS